MREITEKISPVPPSTNLLHVVMLNFQFTRSVVLVPEEAEDMWHAYNLIAVGDRLKSTTIRYNHVAA